MKLDKKEVKNRKSHNESDIIKVQKNISKEIRYDPNKLQHKTYKKQTFDHKRKSTN